MTRSTATIELLKQANRDVHDYVIYGRQAIYQLQVANAYVREEPNQTDESDWAPVTAGLIQSAVKSAYRLSGRDD